MIGGEEARDDRVLKALLSSIRELNADDRQFIQEIVDLRRKRMAPALKDVPLSELGPQYENEENARQYLESARWPSGTVCAHCGSENKSIRLQARRARPGLWHCRACRRQFTVTVGTAFERSHLPLHKWLLANYLICASDGAIVATEIQRRLNVTYETARFTKWRIYEAMEGAGSSGLDRTLQHMLHTPLPDERRVGRGKRAPAKPGTLSGIV